MGEVTLKTIMAGPEGNASPGQKIIVSDKLEKGLAEGGFIKKAEIETAAITPPENEKIKSPRIRGKRGTKK